MDKPLNVFVPMACPHCLAELLPTLDDIQEERTIQCSRCGTTVELHPEDVPTPGLGARDSDDTMMIDTPCAARSSINL